MILLTTLLPILLSTGSPVEMAVLSSVSWPEKVERRVAAMGTELTLQLVGKDRAHALEASAQAIEVIEAVETRLSTWSQDSELSRWNQSPGTRPVSISPELAEDLRRAFYWRDETRGAFNPAIGALLVAWDLRGSGRIPSEAQRLAAQRTAEPCLLHYDPAGKTLERRCADVRVEEGGFGKGVALDRAMAALKRAGIQRASLDFGGQAVVSSSGDEDWTFALGHPEERLRGVLTISIPSGSIATSGNSERGITIDGKRIGHLLDPRTGLPAVDFGTLTVWAKSATDADCLSTALYVMGPAKALRFASTRSDVEVVILKIKGERISARASSGLRGRLSALDSTVEIEWSPTTDNAR